MSQHNINESWSQIRDTIITSRKKIEPPKLPKRKEWMTEEILALMEERRLKKNKDTPAYKEINKKIRSEIRAAKEEWLSRKCSEIEELDRKYDSRNMHKKIKEMCGSYKNRPINNLWDENGKILCSLEDRLAHWKSYIEKLFQDQRMKPHNKDGKNGQTAPPITKTEVIYAIKNCKKGKAAGPDEVTADLIKLIDEDNVNILVDLFNTIHKTGIIPTEWLKSTFVTLPKVNHPKRCEDYRTISLMCHMLKIFLKIIHGRIYRKCEMALTNTQFGFRNGMGTREALFSVNVLVQRCRDVSKNVYMGFIDYRKAFDRVRHNRLIEIMT